MNKEIKLDSGTVVIKTRLSAREYLHLKHYITSRAKLETKSSGYTSNGKPNFETSPTINGKDLADFEAETMRTYIVSFNGDTQNAYEKMLDACTGSEYEKVKDEIDKAYSEEQKK